MTETRELKLHKCIDETRLSTAKNEQILLLWAKWKQTRAHCHRRKGIAGVRPKKGVAVCDQCSNPSRGTEESILTTWKRKLIDSAQKKKNRQEYAAIHTNAFVEHCMFVPVHLLQLNLRFES